MRFGIDTSQYAQLVAHLERCSNQFSPPLAARVDLPAYAQKLVDRTTRFEAWDEEGLVGCVAAYLNAASGECFITNVSVVPTHLRRGIGRILLARCLKAAQQQGLRAALLEVGAASKAAVQLYQQEGFEMVEQKGDVLVMRRALGPEVS